MSKATRAKSLIPKTAEELGKDPILVQDVVDFYYTNLRKMMHSFDYHRINVPFLGTFEIRKSRLEKLIRISDWVIKNEPADNFQKIKKHKQFEERIELGEKLLIKINEDEQKRAERYMDLGKQEKNYRRVKKQFDKK
jgi:hypothetical protein